MSTDALIVVLLVGCEESVPSTRNGPVAVQRAVGTVAAQLRLGPLTADAEVIVVVHPAIAVQVEQALGSSAGAAPVVFGALGDNHDALHVALRSVDQLPQQTSRIVVIHDCARSSITAESISRSHLTSVSINEVAAECLSRAGRPVARALAMTETLKVLDAGNIVRGTLARETLVQIEFPQAVSLSRLRALHARCAIGGPSTLVGLVDDGSDLTLLPAHDIGNAPTAPESITGNRVARAGAARQRQNPEGMSP